MAEKFVFARLHFIVFLWGFTGILGKSISLESVPLVGFRMFFAAFAIYIFMRLRRMHIKVSLRQLLTLCGIGVIIALHWFTFFGSIKTSNVATALSTLSTGAVFTALLEPLFFKRRIKAYELVLGLIVTACIVLIFNTRPDYYLGITLGIICSFLSALFSVFNARLQASMSPEKIMFYELLSGCLFSIPVIALMGYSSAVMEISINDFLFVMLLGFAFTAYPMIESVALMKNISPYTLLLTVNLEPVYGIVLAYFIFGEEEKMSPVFYLATAIMLLSILANSLIKRRLQKSKKELG